MNFFTLKFPFRSFHSSTTALQRPDHALYQSIDWEIVGSGKYAVVDPLDPHSIKYLSNREYIIDSRVAMSNDVSLIVLATPRDRPIPFVRSDPSDPKNSPPEGEEDIQGNNRFESRSGRAAMLRGMFCTEFLNDLLVQKRKLSTREIRLREKKAKEFRQARATEQGQDTRPKAPTISDSSSEIRGPLGPWSFVIAPSTPKKGGKGVRILGSRHRTEVPDSLNYLGAASIREKDRKEAFEPMVVLNESNFIKITLKWGKLLHFRLFGLASASGKDRALLDFTNHLFLIYKNNGVQQVILRLKVYLHVLYAYLAGRPLKSTRDLGTPVRLAHGLPHCFSAATRHAIRARSIKAIRYWTSFCGMYKGLKGTWGSPDYKDIIQPDISVDLNLDFLHFNVWCKNVIKNLFPDPNRDRGPSYPFPTSEFKTKDVYISAKGGPNGKSLIASHWDLVAWLVIAGHALGYFKDKVILLSEGLPKDHSFKKFIFWCTLNLDVIWPYLPWAKLMLLTRDIRLRHAVTKMIFALEELDLSAIADTPGNPITSGFVRKEEGREPTSGVLDKCPPEFEGTLEPLWCRIGIQGGLDVAALVALYEPAGKIRNIVMVDWFSQQVLEPFHRLFFRILKLLPTDATFDQEGAVEAFAAKNLPYVASFDLKAATETISQQLYKAVLEPIVGEPLCSAFIDVLADRNVRIAPTACKATWGSHIRYVRGQPMGALGSWASMALVHHALVQFSAYKAGVTSSRKFFSDYLILGDDVVIGNELVANAYLSLCNNLGVTIGLPKSFISNEGFFNFANQSFFEKQNISPISFKEEITARSPSTRMELALRLIRRGHIDLKSNGWLAPLLRSVLPKPIYKMVSVARTKGKLAPAAKAVLAAASGVLSRMEFKNFSNPLMDGLQGLSVWGYLRIFSSGVSLFSKPLDSTLLAGDNSQDPGLDEAALQLILREAKVLYDQFLKVHPLLLRWKKESQRDDKGRVLNPEQLLDTRLQYLSPILVSYPTLGKRLDDLLEWESKYRRPIKTIIVTGSMQPITLELFEFTCGPLEDIMETLDSARRELPFSPDMVLGVIPETSPELSQDRIYDEASERFSRFAHLVDVANATLYEPVFSRRWSSARPVSGVILEPAAQATNTAR